MKIPLPEGEYIKNIEINEKDIDINFAKRKKVALLFISINDRYWPYLTQVIEDCKKHFLPQHHVDYLVWSDMPKDKVPGTTVYETEPIEWPAPTLMRYHLFLQQEEKLKDYDYLFYLDADMRVVEKISDEILGEGLTVAPHPGYVLNSRWLPPLEPNEKSEAYIQRLGQVQPDEKGKDRFIPFYAAGGFQGGKTDLFIEAMKTMKTGIDKDFNSNYTAIWNDESHWNKYLWDYQKNKGHITFLDVSYVYPDSLIKEYYEPIWGRSYQPKIITLTKPFSLSKQAGAELNEVIGLKPTANKIQCTKCQSVLEQPGYFIKNIRECQGAGRPHEVEMVPV